LTELRATRPLAQFAQSALAVRWLALAALITLEAMEPPRTPNEVALPLYIGILVYALGLTLLAWAFPQRAETTARLSVPFDLAAVLIGMQFSAHPREFFALGFVVCAVTGIVLGQIASVLVAAAVSLLQVPGMPASLFSPDRHLSWGIAALGLLFTATAAAGGKTVRLEEPGGLADLDSVLAQGRSHALDAAITSIMTDLRADSGSIMLFDADTSRLEIIAARGLQESHRQSRPRLGEGIAGWVLQEMRPMLLTPNASLPFELARDEIGSSLSVPLLMGTRPLGVLNLNRLTNRPWFTVVDLDRATTLSRQIRVLLLDAQHERALSGTLAHLAAGQQEVGHALSRDPTVLWPVLLDIARTVTAARFAVLALERDDTGTIDIVSARGIDAPSAKRLLPDLMSASTQGDVHAVNGQEPAPRTVCVPLHVQDRAIGAIALGGLPGDGRVPQALLAAVAAHIAAAVHTARTAYRIADIGVIEERRRIAREIHDGIAQTLADALLQTDLSSMIAQSDPSKLDQDLRELRTLLERAMRELREFMTELRRQEEPNSGLRAALDAVGKEFQRRNAMPVRLMVSGEDAHLPSAVRHAILAIARQALTNVGSHAHAGMVTMRVDITERDCTATITDDGIGFDLAMHRSRPPAAHHLGLTSMEERAALVGGRLQIETAAGRGTTIKVTVPLGRHA
jgi:signal transduction histidine kinase